MPELNHRFQVGRMNKDLDERLVPNGEYRDALNAQVSSSDGSDIGSLQTIMGNLPISPQIIDPLGEFDFYCVGSITDEKTDRIYWLMSGPGKDIIAEYDYTTKQVTPVLVDIFNASTYPASDSGRVLNFDKSFLITGINIIDDYLFWTDNNTEPKSINIPRAKLGTPDWNTHSTLYVKNKDLSLTSIPYTSAGPIQHSDITVIKKSPKIAPSLEMKGVIREDLSSDNIILITSTVTFNDAYGTLWDTEGPDGEGPGWWTSSFFQVTLDSAPDFKHGDFIELTPNDPDTPMSEQSNSIILEICCGNVDFSSGVAVFNAEVVSGNILLNQDTNTFDVKLLQDDALFKFKFPRFGYRYKYEDGQYSTFSPFSEVAFLPTEFDYMPKEGYNLGMVNNVRFLAVKDFVDKKLIPDDVVSIDILYKESNSPIIYSVETIQRQDYQVGKYDRWNGVNATTTSEPPYDFVNTTGYLNITSEIVHAMLPSNQLLRGWDNVPRKALAQEIVGNRLIFGNYLQNYNMSSELSAAPSAFFPYPSLQNLPRDNNITVDLKIGHTITTTHLTGIEEPEEFNPSKYNAYNPSKSIKTLRTYQLGVVYIDEFGRETPVFSASKTSGNSMQHQKKNAGVGCKINAQAFNIKPDWAKEFKFLIKESSNEYYNLAMDRWYDAEDGNIWLSFSSSERNKVDEETFLILKKKHDVSGDAAIVGDQARYKILAIENEAPLFVKTSRSPQGTIQDQAALSTTPGMFVIGSSVGVGTDTSFPQPDNNYFDMEILASEHIGKRLIEEGVVGWEFRVVGTNGVSKWYEIKTFHIQGAIPVTATSYYRVESKKTFGVDMEITSPISWISSNSVALLNPDHGIKIEFAKKTVKSKPEFDGRFFVKIRKDSSVKENIIGPEDGVSTNWQITDSIVSQYINPQAEGDYSFMTNGTTWDDAGERFFGHVPTGGGNAGVVSIRDTVSTPNHHHAVHDGIAKGKSYWKMAGNTPETKSVSNGWFIDKVEAFRPFEYTKHYYTGKDDPGFQTSPFHLPEFASTALAPWGTTYGPPYATPWPAWQLQLIGTDTWKNQTSNDYLGINDLKNVEPGNSPGGIALKNHAGSYSQIFPSGGIDTSPTDGSAIIHLSYTGVNDGGWGAPSSTGFHSSSLRTLFGEPSWAQTMVDDTAFMVAMTTNGTLFRWSDDPDKVVYRIIGMSDPTGTSQTTVEWNKNVRDKGLYTGNNSELGVSLFNYVTFQDYAVKHQKNYTICNPFGPNPDWVRKYAHFVSQNRDSHSTYSVNCNNPLLVPLPAAAHAASGAYGVIEAHIADEAISDGTSGGWGPWSFATFRYPMITPDWDNPANKRRRFQFRAIPYQYSDGSPIVIPGSSFGNVVGTGNYLPTNSPDLPAHHLENGTILTSITNYADTTDSVPIRPATNAPGIRPDGMYSGYDIGGTLIPSVKGAILNTAGTSHTGDSGAAGSCTWQIVVKYYEDEDANHYTTTNPAIWETEPKEDLDLEIYHEVGQIYPVELNDSTMEQFLGPVRINQIENTRVTCWDPINGWINLDTGMGGAGDTDRDIRVNSHGSVATGTERFVYLEDINYMSLNSGTPTSPIVGSRLLFTRADGSRTECTVKSIQVGSNGYELWEDVHNYQVVLPWFNCYSFGNGVESNRIRDDYNQVIIDKGPKVSTVLQEPYMEDRRSTGLIYSGIYNSISNINNLNQFIQAEKITKDLNPDGGSIQKLYARDTNLVTFCEDKIFKILADKDALYNADGNTNITATENVLGQTIPFVGDYGISTNPESFATESFRMYFADRTRGAVLRLSQDGLTPISSVGMRDWFNDNLVFSNRLVGSYDEKKKEYNLSLSYYDYNSYVVYIKGTSKTGAPPFTPINKLKVYHTVANSIQEGDEIIGVGIPPGTFVVSKTTIGGGVYEIHITNTPEPADVAPLGNYIVDFVSPQFGIESVVWPTRITSSKEAKPSNTLSFSETNKGWVSFKSFQHEDGVSLNNEYYTFFKGQLWQHHTNDTHNEFYGDFTESSVTLLLNDIPGSVKSFNTLNYEGSQSHITEDILYSGEYWDNKNKLGWYVNDIHTDLQQGDLHEFKDKEGKWFSQIKGVATEWLNDGTAGNIDTNEFSYQGIDESGAISIVNGGYTSWNCAQVQEEQCCTGATEEERRTCRTTVYIDNLINGIDVPLTTAITSGQAQWRSMIETALAEWFFLPDHLDYLFNDYIFKVCRTAGVPLCPGSSIPCDCEFVGFQYLSGWLGQFYTAREIIIAVNDWAGGNYIFPGDPYSLISWDTSSSSGVNYIQQFLELEHVLAITACDDEDIAISYEDYSCQEIEGLGGTYVTQSSCENDTNSPCGDPCSYSGWAGIVAVDAADVDCLTGDARVVVTMDPSATHWNVEYKNISSGVITVDPTTYTFSGSSDFLGDLINVPVDVGDWEVTVKDSNDCIEILQFSIACVPLSDCNYGPNWTYNSVNGQNTSPHDINIISTTATNTTCDNGELGFSVSLFGNGATSITEISLIDQNATSGSGIIHVDTNPSFNFFQGSWYYQPITGLSSVMAPDLPYLFEVTDDVGTGCTYYYESYLACNTGMQPTYNCEVIYEGDQDIYGCVDPGNGTGIYTGPTALADCQAACSPCDDNVSDSGPGPFNIQPTIGNATGINHATSGNCGTPDTINTGGDGSVQVTMWDANNYTGNATTWTIDYYSNPQLGSETLIYSDPTNYNIASTAPVSAAPLNNISSDSGTGSYYSYYITAGPLTGDHCVFGPYPFEIDCITPADNWLCHAATCTPTTLPLTNINVYSTLAACQAGCPGIITSVSSYGECSECPSSTWPITNVAPISNANFELAIAKRFYQHSTSQATAFWSPWYTSRGEVPKWFICEMGYLDINKSAFIPTISGVVDLTEFKCLSFISCVNQPITELDLRTQAANTFYKLMALSTEIQEIWLPWNLDYPGQLPVGLGGSWSIAISWTATLASDPSAHLIIHCAHPHPDPYNPTTPDRIARAQQLIGPGGIDLGVSINPVGTNYSLVP